MSSSHLSSGRKFSVPNAKNSFSLLSREELVTHIAISKYGSFRLTNAIRPSYDLKILPEEAYCRRIWRNRNNGNPIPVIAGMVSREKLMGLFFDLMAPLGNKVDVVVESSHFRRRGHTDYTRDEIDLSVLKSILLDYEDILLNDGYLGVAVLNQSLSLEVHFDEHKVLSVFGRGLAMFERIFRRYGIEQKDSLRFLAEEEHIHGSDPVYRTRFESLCRALGTEFNFMA